MATLVALPLFSVIVFTFKKVFNLILNKQNKKFRIPLHFNSILHFFFNLKIQYFLQFTMHCKHCYPTLPRMKFCPQILGFVYLSGVLGFFNNDMGFLSNFVGTCKNIELSNELGMALVKTST